MNSVKTSHLEKLLGEAELSIAPHSLTSQISQNKSLSSLTIHMEQAGSRDTDGIVFIDLRPALVLPSAAREACREAEAMGKAPQKEENERMLWFRAICSSFGRTRRSRLPAAPVLPSQITSAFQLDTSACHHQTLARLPGTEPVRFLPRSVWRNPGLLWSALASAFVKLRRRY
ncbi:unnamed protein product [Rangifer tarandus platyrhynchus]|uniref:Uncharacterized protein n=1 Tax=Rangifer tarandus platyrhynchus TaxID=3082113 RepID=A0ABN8ZLF6_RANTA|nr:unnamed protein product [Rangifer tarandus platyrhynchus]